MGRALWVGRRILRVNSVESIDREKYCRLLCRLFERSFLRENPCSRPLVRVPWIMESAVSMRKFDMMATVNPPPSRSERARWKGM